MKRRRQPKHSARTMTTASSPFSFLLCSSLCFLLTSTTLAQEAPYYTTPQFTEYTTTIEGTHRQDVCDRSRAVTSKEIALRDALRGLQLRTGIFAEEYLELTPYVDEDGMTTTNGTMVLNEEYPGLLAILLDELAARAGFTWRNSYGITVEPEGTGNRTFTDLLVWTASTYDISADWWPNTIERLNRGITFQVPWYDSNIIMIMNTDQATAYGRRRRNGGGGASFELFSWLEPFSYDVWILTIVTIVVSALVYQGLERIDGETDDLELENEPGWNIFLAAITFTGHFSYQPRTNPARLTTVSLTLIALLIASAYTANLASFLVVRNTPSLIIETLDDAVRQNMPLCVSGLTDAGPTIRMQQPSATVIQLDTEEEIFVALRNGECLVAVTTVVSWRLHEGSDVANPDCSLMRVGRTVTEIPASFGFFSDAGTFCTSLIRDVLNIHMAEMEQVGFIESAWVNEVERRRTRADCTAELAMRGITNNDDSEDDAQLTLQDLGGIFLAHYAFTAISVIFVVARKLCEKRQIFQWLRWPWRPVQTHGMDDDDDDDDGYENRDATNGSMGHHSAAMTETASIGMLAKLRKKKKATNTFPDEEIVVTTATDIEYDDEEEDDDDRRIAAIAQAIGDEDGNVDHRRQSQEGTRLQQQRQEDFEYIISMLRRMQADSNTSGATGEVEGRLPLLTQPAPAPLPQQQQQRRRTLARHPSDGVSSPSLQANRRMFSQAGEHNDGRRRGGGPTMHRPMHYR